MNEELPPDLPPELPPYTPEPGNSGQPPSKGKAALWGVGLFVASVIASILTFGIGGLAGIGVAIASLFYPGYRYVFVGFLLSLVISLGVICLLLVVLCSGPMDFK